MVIITYILIFGGLAGLYFMYKTYRAKQRSVQVQTQNIEEDINLMQDELHHQEALISAYNARLERYDALEGMLNKFNTTLVLEDIISYLTEEVFKLVAQSEGNVIIYLLNKSRQKLEILKSLRQPEEMVIKAKEGDSFDYWVLKQARPLLVENAKTDFRFDLNRMDNEFLRNIESLIAAPIISRDNFLGILRIDRDTKRAFNSEDLRLLSTISDIAALAIENALLYKRTHELAIVDSLTHLYQREYFLTRLEEELLRSKNESKQISLIMLDIDYFKNYNDQFGHIAGDIVLKRVASVLRNFLDPARSLCCRFGGEEYLLYLINSSQQEACQTAERLRKEIEDEKIILRRQRTSVTVSLGVVCFPHEATTSEDLMKIVDQRMYKAKSSGRNQVCCS